MIEKGSASPWQRVCRRCSLFYGPGSGDRPANPCPYRRDPEIRPLWAASEKHGKYRPLSCPPGGPYDWQ